MIDLLVLNVGNEGMIHFITINGNPSNPHSHPFPAKNLNHRSPFLIGWLINKRVCLPTPEQQQVNDDADGINQSPAPLFSPKGH